MGRQVVRKTLVFLFIFMIIAPSCLAYQNITQQEAKNLLKEDIIVIDCRPCKCNYDKGHIEGAIWSVNPVPFYNSEKDIMVYGDDSDEFCENLSSNTDVAIYNLYDYTTLFDYSRSAKLSNFNIIIFGIGIVLVLCVISLYITIKNK